MRSLFAFALLSTLQYALAFNFNFTTELDQCANVSLSWTAGTPPYEVLLVPVGHVSPEIRTIINYQNLTSTSLSFPLTFPASSQFVTVLSDASGPGSGGTSDVLTVKSSNASSCLATTPSKPKFYFYLDPPVPDQCSPLAISWDKLSNSVSSSPSVWGVVPLGPTFAIPINSTTSYDWTVDVPAGKKIMLVAGMNGVTNGRGLGGSSDLLTVGSGESSKCLVAGGETASVTRSGAATATVGSTVTVTASSASGSATGQTGGSGRSVSSSRWTAVVIAMGGLFAISI